VVVVGFVYKWTNTIIEPLKGKTYEEIHGDAKAAELKKKRSEQQLRRSVTKGRTYEELYGKERALEMKQECSQRMKGNKHAETVTQETLRVTP